MTKNRLVKFYNLIFLVCFIIISSDVLNFFSSANNSFIDDLELPKVDGVVVFSGGENRIQSAVQILSKGYGERLFISGVNPMTKKNDISLKLISDKAIFTCCIDLGNNATNTLENANETKEWIGELNYKNVIIVTSNYHMKRSLFILRNTIPEVNFISFPIKSSYANETGKFNYLNFKLLANEYLKYVYTRLYFLILPN